MFLLIRGDLETREKRVVQGPRVEPYRVEADALNMDHWNFWRKMLAPLRLPKRYIWWTEETKWDTVVRGYHGTGLIGTESGNKEDALKAAEQYHKEFPNRRIDIYPCGFKEKTTIVYPAEEAEP